MHRSVIMGTLNSDEHSVVGAEDLLQTLFLHLRLRYRNGLNSCS